MQRPCTTMIPTPPIDIRVKSNRDGKFLNPPCHETLILDRIDYSAMSSYSSSTLSHSSNNNDDDQDTPILTEVYGWMVTPPSESDRYCRWNNHPSVITNF